MNIDDLYRVLNEEKRSQALRELPPNFYAEVARYIEELQGSLDEADEGREFLEDEWKSARRVLQDLVDLRLNKMAQRALYTARGMAAEPPPLLEEEKAALERFQSAAQEERTRLLQGLRLQPQTPQSPSRGRKRGRWKESPKGPAPGGAAERPGEPRKVISPPGEFTLVRVVKDLPPFVGADGRTYRLKSEDVVMLPNTNVEPLVKRGVAVALQRPGPG